MATSADYDALPPKEALLEVLEEPKDVKTLDDFMRMGRYCFLILIFAEFALLAGAGNMIFMMYAGAVPNAVSCRGPEVFIEDLCATAFDYSNPPNCTVETKADFVSVNVDFGYVCDAGNWVKTSISMQMLGVLFGTVIAGNLSDRLGRLRVLSFSFVFVAIFSVATAFSTNLLVFTVFRTILGVFNGGLVGTYGVYKIEHVPRRHRFLVATIVSWAPNMMLLSVVAWWTQDWRTFQLAILVLSSPAALLYFFVNESPRWLIQRGRVAEARRVLRKIQKMDGAKESSKEELEKMLDNEQKIHEETLKQKKNYDMRDLFSTKYFTFITFVMLFGKVTTSLTTYGLIFNIEKLAGSIFINSLVMASLRWVFNVSIGAIDYKCKSVGRKVVHFAAQFTIALCLLFIFGVFLLDGSSEYSWAVRIASLIAMSTASQVFITKSIVTVEFYPTMVRNSAIAIQSMASRIGTILAPQLFILSPYRSIPYAVLSLVSLMDCLVFQASLPETKNINLPDKVPDNSCSAKMNSVNSPLVPTGKSSA
ncbi:unnamed protein product [Caenorhabditis auriculariae]|uniref:Major facilitator superfamily (MFS) profile domain-containing protein n=1 Tax=Caenorhabditis auriculariae TaxID=2777116 RepID=A0A8S1HI35_9PELO|nr:unnamed protein product [Caenorhabditis auriculariae]